MLAARTTAVPKGAQPHLALIAAGTGHDGGAEGAGAAPRHGVESAPLMRGQVLAIAGEQGGPAVLDELREMQGTHQLVLPLAASPEAARTAQVRRSTSPLTTAS